MKNKKSDELKIIIFGESYSNYQIYVVIHVQLENKKLRVYFTSKQLWLFYFSFWFLISIWNTHSKIINLIKIDNQVWNTTMQTKIGNKQTRYKVS